MLLLLNFLLDVNVAFLKLMFRLLRRLEEEAKTLFSLLFGPLSQALQNGEKN
jgi:hypothetical protein